MQRFIGWIPNLTGRIFFQFSQCDLYANGVYCDQNHSEIDPGTKQLVRHILISSDVDWKDDESSRHSGHFRLFLLARRIGDADTMTGQLHITDESGARKSWTGLRNKIQTLNDNVRNEANIAADYEGISEFLNNYSNPNHFVVDISICRQGFVELSTSLNGHTPIESELTERIICRQAYYYVKYAFHAHRHHHRSAESLTTIHPIRDNNQTLALRLIDDLKRSVVRLKRDIAINNTTEEIDDTRGIIAYAKTLVVSCHENRWIDPAERNKQLSYLSHTSDSLGLAYDKVLRKRDSRYQISNEIRGILLFTLALAGPLLLVYRDRITAFIAHPDPQEDIAFVRIMGRLFGDDLSMAVSALGLFALLFTWGYLRYRYGFIFEWILSSHTALQSIVFSRYKAIVLIAIFILLGMSLIIGAFAIIVR